MSWILLSLLSALFLGLYDIAKKVAVRDNAVPPVLLCNVATAAMLWIPLAAISRCSPSVLSGTLLMVERLGWQVHVMLAAKSCLVAASWTFAFFALKHLPISIATPSVRFSEP